METVLLTFLSELFAIGYASFLIYLVKFLKDPDAPLEEGIWKACVFGVLMVANIVCKNQYMMKGSVMGIKMRKTIIGSMH